MQVGACPVGESFDFSDKIVHPVTMHAMSGLGTAPDDYAQSCKGARIGSGLAVRGEKVRSAGTAVDRWLARARLLGGVRRSRLSREQPRGEAPRGFHAVVALVR